MRMKANFLRFLVCEILRGEVLDRVEYEDICKLADD